MTKMAFAQTSISNIFGRSQPPFLHFHSECDCGHATLGRLRGAQKVACWSKKSGNISEMRKGRVKVTMEGI